MTAPTGAGPLHRGRGARASRDRVDLSGVRQEARRRGARKQRRRQPLRARVPDRRSHCDVASWRPQPQAHYEAEATLAQLRHDLGDVTGIDTDRYLVEPYRESDPSCAIALRVSELLRHMIETIEQIIPPGTKKFQGVGIEGPWEPSADVLEMMAEREAARNAETLERVEAAFA